MSWIESEDNAYIFRPVWNHCLMVRAATARDAGIYTTAVAPPSPASTADASPPPEEESSVPQSTVQLRMSNIRVKGIYRKSSLPDSAPNL